MKTRDEFYSHPEYYDIAFDLNRKKECEFLTECFARYGRGKIRSVLDIACGTGQHLIRLARQGYEVGGLDLSPENIAYVRAKARAERFRPHLIVGDMTRFTVPRPYDAAICMQDSMGHLLTNEEIIRHLRVVARALRPGGLYIFDRLIPNHWSNPASRWAWTKRRGPITIRTTFLTLRNVDPVRQLCREQIRFEVSENGTHRTFRQQHRSRVVFPQELRALVECAGTFDFVQWFSNFDIRRPLDRARAPLFMVTVLRKKKT